VAAARFCASASHLLRLPSRARALASTAGCPEAKSRVAQATNSSLMPVIHTAVSHQWQHRAASALFLVLVPRYGGCYFSLHHGARVDLRLLRSRQPACYTRMSLPLPCMRVSDRGRV
jgi:hypothetical protein